MANGLAGDMGEVVGMLARISRLGPVHAIGTGDTSVGMTLLSHLGIPYSSIEKPNFKGIVITARRGTRARDLNRVNLFARVPDWDISSCKSSREIVARFGYDRDNGRKLYCTVRARKPNNQGLMLVVDKGFSLVHEVHRSEEGVTTPVASWRLGGLLSKLEKSHGASIWVIAIPSKKDDAEYFHFRYATITSAPKTTEFASLIEQGTITMDHLIWEQSGRNVEKGPLFKINPGNVDALFPVSAKLDLLTL